MKSLQALGWPLFQALVTRVLQVTRCPSPPRAATACPPARRPRSTSTRCTRWRPGTRPACRCRRGSACRTPGPASGTPWARGSPPPWSPASPCAPTPPRPASPPCRTTPTSGWRPAEVSWARGPAITRPRCGGPRCRAPPTWATTCPRASPACLRGRGARRGASSARSRRGRGPSRSRAARCGRTSCGSSPCRDLAAAESILRWTRVPFIFRLIFYSNQICGTYSRNCILNSHSETIQFLCLYGEKIFLPKCFKDTVLQLW